MNPFKNTIVCVTLVSIQMFCILFTNTFGIIEDYYTLEDPNGIHTEDLKIGLIIGESPIFKTYANYSGTSSGYGFYSPNVGSEFVMSFAVLDQDGKILGQHQNPINFKQKESLSRFSLCTLPMMQRIIIKESNEIYDNYFKVMMHQIAESIKDSYAEGYKVVAEIYIHKYPNIERSLNGETENFALLERYTFRF